MTLDREVRTKRRVAATRAQARWRGSSRCKAPVLQSAPRNAPCERVGFYAAMVTPSRTTPLFDEVRKLSVLQRAWEHVRAQAARSSDPDTKRAKGQIDADPLKYLRNLQRELGTDRFQFEKQKGILKRRAGKDPRPIVVAPLRNRIVQRAILDVCQSDAKRLQRNLGRLPERLATPTSVGGLPKRGVGCAMHLIKAAIDTGATHYVRSDLKNFFANIPRAPLDKFLDTELRDEAFVTLFKAALDVELANADDAEIRRWWELFPSSDLGVPQGSALSAMSANIILSDFDQILNDSRLVTVRYLDDFLILGSSEAQVDRAWQAGSVELKRLGLEAHKPGESTKADKGSIADGFDFLSFRVRGANLSPSKAAKADLAEQIRLTIKAAKRSIQEGVAEPRRAQHRFAQTLELLDRKIRGWGDAFGETTQRVEFTQLDEKLDLLVMEFVQWFGRWQKSQNLKHRRRGWGISLLSDTPYPKPNDQTPV